MRWIALFMPALLVWVACSDTSDTAIPPSPTPAPGTFEQRVYDLWLDFTREAVAEDADLACNPDTWVELGANPDLSATERVLLEVAFIDACKEAGQLSEAAGFSPYYPGQP